MSAFGMYYPKTIWRKPYGWNGSVVPSVYRAYGPGLAPSAPRRRPPTGTSSGAPLRGRMRMKLKNAVSATLTRRKKRKNVNLKSHGDNQTFSVNSIGKNKSKKSLLQKLTAPQTIFTNLNGNASSTQGKQGVTVFSFLQKADLTSIETGANGGVTTNNNIRFYLKTGKFVLKLRNQSNSNCKLTIYDIVTKRTPPVSTYSNPLQCWSKGMNDYGITSGYQIVSNTPFKSPEFRQYFAVNKTVTISLEPGQQHDHTVYHKYNKLVDSVRFQNSSSLAIQGLTRYCMIVYHGLLGHESTAPAVVTYLPVTLDYASSYEWSYGYIDKTSPTYVMTDNNPTTVADFDFMGESGDIDTNANVA